MADYLRDVDRLFSLASEAALLGSMMLEPGCIPYVLAIITTTEMFYIPRHQCIFEALVHLHLDKVSIDAVSVRDWLVNHNLYQQAGGVEYIGQILDSVPSAANHEYYAKQVRDKAQFRELVRTVEEIKKIPDEPEHVNDMILELHRTALAIQIKTDAPGFRFSALENLMDSVGKIADLKAGSLKSGYGAIDGLLYGFRNYEFILLAGRPGMGKTSLMMGIANRVAKRGERVMVFSLEMSAEALVQRVACSEAQVNPDRWPLNQRPPQEEFNALCSMIEKLHERPIIIYENLDTVQQMYAAAQIEQRASGLDLVCVDNIQIMTTSPLIDKEVARLTDISRRLKRMAVDLKIPILAVSHLNRAVTTRSSNRPYLSDLRGSGTLEQDADIVMLLHREDEYRKLKKPNIDREELDGEAEVIVAKNRRGKTGIARLSWREEFATFYDLSKYDPTLQEEQTQ